MNVLLVVEGRSSEKTVYRRWIRQQLPQMRYVESAPQLHKRIFTIVSGGRYPNYRNAIRNAIKDAISRDNVDYLLICIDAEEKTRDIKYREINRFISDECDPIPHRTRLHIIIQDCCLESWLLGNNRIRLQTQLSPEILSYRRHYNVNLRDPELMESADDRTDALYAYGYLRVFLPLRNMNYTKSNPRCIATKTYFETLCRRSENTGHLISFSIFAEIIQDMKMRLENK